MLGLSRFELLKESGVHVRACVCMRVRVCTFVHTKKIDEQALRTKVNMCKQKYSSVLRTKVSKG